MRDKHSISIIGGNARNKGALLMLNHSLDLISSKTYQKIYIFTPFPNEDTSFICNNLKTNNLSVEIIKWSTIEILKSLFLILFPIKKNSILNSLKDSKVTLDISGITFVEDRGLKYLIYNSLTILIPYYCKSKIIKLPQSIGPIQSNYYKKIASFFLGKCSSIYSRGEHSSEVLKNLNLEFIPSSDLGFLEDADLSEPKTNIYRIGISPSIVIKKYFVEKNLDYESFLINLINDISKLGYKLILFPQSYSTNSEKGTFDDSSIINNIAPKIKRDNIEIINQDLSLEELKNIYSTLDVCITSRFHGVVMAINSNVYPIVIGWNHKYHELLMSLELENSSINIEKNISFEIISRLKILQNNYSQEIKKLFMNRGKIFEEMKNIKKDILIKIIE